MGDWGALQREGLKVIVVRLSNFSGDTPSNPSNGTRRADGFLTDNFAP
ncbi:hypothetical protein [Paenibacillus eucommiae]|uniref:Uncharacterized protein n=1 Tax=Paenibacillus eucommiae TaxID=1355755 RepID=A0ABS4J296_9BACL|nr:hypothetical protein [Paenibacillus eucommiae]MBP1993376.1 hypothetical protein [Paenibacillus eucommiae]